MKAKLLKKLRRKYAKQYPITRNSHGWAVWYGGYGCDYYQRKTFEEAKQEVEHLVRCKIIDYVAEKRRTKRSHAIIYYPW